MSRTLFAAGRLLPSLWARRTYNCTNPACAEPREAITVSLRWEPGIGDIGLLAGWTAGDVVAHCGCVLADHERAALAAEAEDDANEWGRDDAD